MKTETKSVIYMVDTNILIKWAMTYTSAIDILEDWQRKAALQIKVFCEENRNEIVVPDLVWVEFLSVMLHKDIDVNDNFESTLCWCRNQQSLAQQIEGMMRNSDNWNLDWEPDISPFRDASELLWMPNLIDKKTFEWMKKSAQDRKKKYAPEMERLKAKILDGMDSAILICLNELASQDENRHRQVVLYTADLPLCRIIERVKRLNVNWFAQNTSAVFALSNRVMCRHMDNDRPCRQMNDPEILLENKMICDCHRDKKKHTLKL